MKALRSLLLVALLACVALPAHAQSIFVPGSSGKVLCSSLAGTCSCTGLTDASTQNTWNVMSCQLPAGTLLAAGDYIDVIITARAAANTNAKEFQLYWNGATCSGTNATMCSSGTQLSSAGSSTSGVQVDSRSQAIKTGASTQNLNDLTILATSISSHVITTATATDTGAVQISWGVRNTAAAAASVQGTPTLTIVAHNQQ